MLQPAVHFQNTHLTFRRWTRRKGVLMRFSFARRLQVYSSIHWTLCLIFYSGSCRWLGFAEATREDGFLIVDLPPTTSTTVTSDLHQLMKNFADLPTKCDYFYVSQGSCSYLGFPETRPVGGFLIVDVLRPLPPRCIVAIFFDEDFCSPVH